MSIADNSAVTSIPMVDKTVAAYKVETKVQGQDIEGEVRSVDPATDVSSRLESFDRIEEAVRIINEALAREPVALEFRVDDTLNRPVVTVLNKETGDVIHQLPSDEVLRAVKNIDVMRGILYEQRG
jgi:uncharacterized FlaG/YvyC family protein